MNGSSGMRSSQQVPASREHLFEADIGSKLSEKFRNVEPHARIRGYSGINWNVDYLVDSSLIVEATVQKRLETKINSTFIRFMDITRLHPELKGALLVEKLHVLFHRTLGKHYFPTSEYRTFLSFGFAIVTPGGLPKLADFQGGMSTASEISSKPEGFYARSIQGRTRLLGAEVVRLLKEGPLPLREIAKSTGGKDGTILDAIRMYPQIKKVSTYYGLSEDEIYRFLLRRGGAGPIQGQLVRRWATGAFLRSIEKHGTYKTSDFERDMGVGHGHFSHLVNRLRKDGVIRHVAKGEWALDRVDIRPTPV